LEESQGNAIIMRNLLDYITYSHHGFADERKEGMKGGDCFVGVNGIGIF